MSGPRTGPPPTSAKRWRAACGDSARTTSTSTSCTTRAWTRSSATTCSRSSTGCAKRASCATTGWRWARRSAGGTRACARSRSATWPRLQTVYNVLEQQPGERLPRGGQARRRRRHGPGAHVERAAGGQVHARDDLPRTDHRSHRPREWLVEGLQKVERLRFLSEEHGFTMAQGALKFILAQDAIACVLPTVYNVERPRRSGRPPPTRRPRSARGPGPDRPSSTSATSTSSPSLRQQASCSGPRASRGRCSCDAPQHRHLAARCPRGHGAQRPTRNSAGRHRRPRGPETCACRLPAPW